jgi:dihydrodipicolinate synthase/N-acetylneuraminate lyase
VNFVPEMMVEQFRVFRQGESGTLEPTASRMREVGAAIDRLTFTLNVAAGMEARGLEVGAPKMVVSAASEKIYREIVETLRAKFAAWGLPPAGHSARPTRRRAA